MDVSPVLAETVGWLATAVFTASFLFQDATRLRTVQIAGALVWIVYGLLISSLPVVVANVLVFSMACVTTARYHLRSKACRS
jgi:uncharacterized protein with PQ loop repeat